MYINVPSFLPTLICMCLALLIMHRVSVPSIGALDGVVPISSVEFKRKQLPMALAFNELEITKIYELKI